MRLLPTKGLWATAMKGETAQGHLPATLIALTPRYFADTRFRERPSAGELNAVLLDGVSREGEGGREQGNRGAGADSRFPIPTVRLWKNDGISSIPRSGDVEGDSPESTLPFSQSQPSPSLSSTSQCLEMMKEASAFPRYIAGI